MVQKTFPKKKKKKLIEKKGNEMLHAVANVLHGEKNQFHSVENLNLYNISERFYIYP